MCIYMYMHVYIHPRMYEEYTHPRINEEEKQIRLFCWFATILLFSLFIHACLSLKMILW